MEFDTCRPKRTKLFQGLEIELTPSLQLKFDIFDFPLAQRWASIMASMIGIREQDWRVSAPQPYLNFLQNELEFLLLCLQEDQESVDFLRGLEKEDGAFPPTSLEKIRSSAFFRRERREGSYEAELFKRLQSVLRSLERTAAKKRKARVTGISVSPVRPKRPFTQLLENEDFAHFQDERMPGGLRLNSSRRGKSVLESAHTRNFRHPPSPWRRFGPSFRVDLSSRYPPLAEWDDYQKQQAWAREADYDLSDRRHGADCVYVARLCPADLARIGEIADGINDAGALAIKSIALIPAADRGPSLITRRSSCL